MLFHSLARGNTRATSLLALAKPTIYPMALAVAGDSTAGITLGSTGVASGVGYQDIALVAEGTGEKQAIFHVPQWAQGPSVMPGDIVQAACNFAVQSGSVAWAIMSIYEQSIADAYLADYSSPSITGQAFSVEQQFQHEMVNVNTRKTSYAIVVGMNAPATATIRICPRRLRVFRG